ncbi:hypothetical protein [Ancylobacter rudongensis]|uniref:Uncharacterized protein n=1 Tax=Ancylobacter rudongensis TaxID=177413 RepID=A0A1G4URB5_9HYPH|nr:hypothetical protein [Ancylobacter rudongensis]SCW95369.1 hypothetical protein SAMN05660859_0011 [Ancylobacter rudongensis]
MTKMIFNAHKPVVTHLGALPAIGDDWPVDDWKYADVEFVYPRTTDLVRTVIDRAPITGKFKRVLIDVKVQDLTPEFCSCIPGWHLDGAFPKPGALPDHHHLFVMNGPLTEFIDEPVACEVSYPVDMPAILRQIPRNVRIGTCAPNAITTFTSYDFHRGVTASAPTRRLLVRLTETNTVFARNTPKAPSQGARTLIGEAA